MPENGRAQGGMKSESDHTPVEVWSVDGMPFVRCSCDMSGPRPQSAVWLREHWQGTEDDGVAALRGVVARQREEASREASENPTPPEGHPCGHAERTTGCGGCDPAAIEFVITDEGERRPFDAALDMNFPPGQGAGA